MFRQRIRLKYSVGGDKRFLSHRDMMRLWHRALRRSGLPLRMSEGFHVRPRVSFALARGVGIVSESEWLEFELADWVNPDTVSRKLAAQLPADLTVRQLTVVAPRQRAAVRQAVYEVQLHCCPADLDARIAALLERDRIVVERGRPDKRRTLDIRPLLVSLEREGPQLRMVADCRSDGTLKPDEILGELGLSETERARCLVVRTDLALAGDSG